MKHLLTFCLAAAPTMLACAQTTGQVTGRLLDAQQQPVAFVTVLLQALPDTLAVRAAQAGADGRYAFAGVGAGRYRLMATMLGYERYYSSPFELTGGQPSAVLPVAQLRPAAQQLASVQVTGQRPLLEMQGGKLVVNVAASPATAGGTALEALQKVPGLLVMGNRLSLAGREGLTILLDGRTTHYTDVVSVLKDLPSSNIERIEVLSQPGAAYDAAGSAGIINIILKKNAEQGTNGTVGLNGGYGRFGKGGATLDGNHRAGGLNVFGSYGYSYRRTYEQLNTDRALAEVGQPRTYQQQSYQPRTTHVNTARLGADYALSPRQTLGVLLSGYTTRTIVSAENSIAVNEGALGRTDTRSTSRRPTDSYTANLNYKLALSPQGRALTLDADYSRYITANDTRLTNRLQTNLGAATQQLGFEQQTAIRLASAKADYLHPLGTGGKLATGAKISAADIDSQLDFSALAAGGWQPDASRSDHFRYQERIAAAYLSLDQQVAGVQVQAGLRAEQTHSVATSMALDKTVARDYLQLFPSLSLDKPLTKKLGATLGYSHRIDRPSYQDLNPSIVYLDPYSQQRGNPFLRPQLTNSVQAGLTYQKQPMLLLAYTRTTEAISLATAQQDSVLYQTTANLGRLANYSATLNFPISLGKRVSGYGGTIVYYNQYRSEYLGGQYDNGQLSATFYLQTKVSLPKGIGLEVSGFLQTAGVNGLLNYRPFGALNLGVQKSFWHDQAQLRLAATDALFTSQQRGTVRYQDLNVRFFNQTESQQVRLSFTYKLGNQALRAARKRTTSLDEERGRVKTDKE
ncbi:outer membrane beta-barrel protein [Hymenobacter bucti]|uniref:Outer membrane beta-barrel protein n=1 Tax=Hymenobacter bucti TaxID=1844114 RepID=A0ABW4QPK1_9BACT